MWRKLTLFSNISFCVFNKIRHTVLISLYFKCVGFMGKINTFLAISLFALLVKTTKKQVEFDSYSLKMFRLCRPSEKKKIVFTNIPFLLIVKKLVGLCSYFISNC